MWEQEAARSTLPGFRHRREHLGERRAGSVGRADLEYIRLTQYRASRAPRLLVPEILAREVCFRLVVPDFLAAGGCPDPDGNSEATPHLSEIFAVRAISAYAQWVSAVPTGRLGGIAVAPLCVVFDRDRW